MLLKSAKIQRNSTRPATRRNASFFRFNEVLYDATSPLSLAHVAFALKRWLIMVATRPGDAK
jgi:hypothetical protein